MPVANATYTRTNSFGPEHDGIVPRFFIESIPDELATAREGRPIFRDQERVELLTPGNSLNVPVQIVSNEHRTRWPKQYEAFRQGQEMSADGTPLEQWPILKRSQVLELKAMNLMTVEHVRDMNDHATQAFMGGLRLRQLAKSYLDDAEAGAALSKATADNERHLSAISELTRKLEEQGELLNRVHTELQTLRNAPSPIATHVPGMFDPIEQAKQSPEPAGGSSLDSLPAVRRGPGRPPGSKNAVA